MNVLRQETSVIEARQTADTEDVKAKPVSGLWLPPTCRRPLHARAHSYSASSHTKATLMFQRLISAICREGGREEAPKHRGEAVLLSKQTNQKWTLLPSASPPKPLIPWLETFSPFLWIFVSTVKSIKYCKWRFYLAARPFCMSAFYNCQMWGRGCCRFEGTSTPHCGNVLLTVRRRSEYFFQHWVDGS